MFCIALVYNELAHGIVPNLHQVFAALWFKAKGAFSNNLDRQDPDVAFCNDMLGKVSQTEAVDRLLLSRLFVHYLECFASIVVP